MNVLEDGGEDTAGGTDAGVGKVGGGAKEQHEEHLDKKGGKRFLIITTQRSGSSWFSQTLRSQHGIASTMELMIQYTTFRCCTQVPALPCLADLAINICAQPCRDCNCVLSFDQGRQARSVPFDEWVGKAEQQLALVADADPTAVAHGFKIMYNQIPIWLQPQFAEWVKQERIAVIHLVREATLESAASQIAALNKSDGGLVHTLNHSLAEQAKHDQPIHLKPSQWAQIVKDAEAMTGWWDKFLIEAAGNHGGYHRLTYESLLGAGHDDAIGGVLKFLSPEWTKERWPIQKPKGELLMMHPPGCADRIGGYPAVRQAIAGTRTAKACDALAAPSEA